MSQPALPEESDINQNSLRRQFHLTICGFRPGLRPLFMQTFVLGIFLLQTVFLGFFVSGSNFCLEFSITSPKQ